MLRDGERIPVDVAAVRDLPAPQSAIYWSDRIQLLQLPRLRPGDGIEVRTLRKGFTYALLGTPSGAAAAADDARFVPPMPGRVLRHRGVRRGGADPREALRAEPARGQAPARRDLQRRRSTPASPTTPTAPSTPGGGATCRPWPTRRAQPAASDFAPKVVMATVAELGEQEPLVLRRQPRPVRRHAGDPRQGPTRSSRRPRLTGRHAGAQGRGPGPLGGPEHPLQRPDDGPGRGLHPAPRRDDLRAAQRRLQGHRRHADHHDARRRHGRARRR